jgi:hypothetical protein
MNSVVIRPFLDFMILCSQHPLCTGAALLLLWLAARRRQSDVHGNTGTEAT